jgi:hypothetical protein
MKILLYHPRPFHVDLYGCFLEYFNSLKIIPTIYTNVLNEIFLFYLGRGYKFNLTTGEFIFFPEQYDLIFLLDDLDASLNNVVSGTKVIRLQHQNQIRNSILNSRNLFIRPFPNCGDNWILPVFKGISLVEKLNYVQNQIRQKIVFLGNSLERKKDIACITNFVDCDVYIINRYLYPEIEEVASEYKNVQLCIGIDSLTMMTLLFSAQYIVIPPNKEEFENSMVLSSSVFQSFACCCCLVLSKKANKYLNLTSALTYDSRIEIPIFDQKKLQEILVERDLIIDRNFSVLEKERTQIS